MIDVQVEQNIESFCTRDKVFGMYRDAILCHADDFQRTLAEGRLQQQLSTATSLQFVNTLHAIRQIVGEEGNFLLSQRLHDGDTFIGSLLDAIEFNAMCSSHMETDP